ncbi:MAG: O-antigen ligase family protein [Bryobacterales bacterium]|nr:O-antigen ligase family protein [Bryobacterales bacterium]
MKIAALSALALAFAWTALRGAGFLLADWNITVLAIAFLAVPLLAKSQAPPLSRRLAWPLTLLPVWVLLQIAPLPAALVALLSPARAELAAALAPPGWVPLSVFPALTLAAWVRLAACLLVFLSVRELAWRYSNHATPWAVVLPFVLIACLEAALGLVQFYAATARASGAQGTYGSRDHFAGLMEMALPFPVMYGIAALRRRPSPFRSPLRPALTACAAFSAAALLLLGAIHSLSRMGFIAALFALAVLAAAALPRRFLLAAPALLLLFFYLPPAELIARFADLSTPSQISAQDRLQLWRETLPLAAAFPLTGCGLGAFESAFMPFKRSAPLNTDNFAHNDYLQYAAELGLPGLALALLALYAVLAAALRAASHATPSARALALASLASMSALLLHSLVDFNSYIPGNAFAFAWVAGMAVSYFPPRRTLEIIKLPL